MSDKGGNLKETKLKHFHQQKSWKKRNKTKLEQKKKEPEEIPVLKY